MKKFFEPTIKHLFSAWLGATIMFVWSAQYIGDQTPKTQAYKELSEHLESIDSDKICDAIKSGNQILGDDHIQVWFDQKRYLLVGWRVQKSGIPVFDWTGADLPSDCDIPHR